MASSTSTLLPLAGTTTAPSTSTTTTTTTSPAAAPSIDITDLSSATRSSSGAKRVSTHTHISGLGLDAQGRAMPTTVAGLVGQERAREACGVVVDLIRSKRMAGRALLLAGAPGVALPAALALDIDTPEDLARAERMLARG